MRRLAADTQRSTLAVPRRQRSTLAVPRRSAVYPRCSWTLTLPVQSPWSQLDAQVTPAASLSFGACDAAVGASCEDGVQCAAGSMCGTYRSDSLALVCLEICSRDEDCEPTETCQGLGGTDVCRAKPK